MREMAALRRQHDRRGENKTCSSRESWRWTGSDLDATVRVIPGCLLTPGPNSNNSDLLGEESHVKQPNKAEHSELARQLKDNRWK